MLGAHELKEGATYFILLTTAFGLYRYHIHDVVRVAGFHNGTPLIEFLSKGATSPTSPARNCRSITSRSR